MASPPVRRQLIPLTVIFPTTTSTTSSPAIPTTTTTTTGNSPSPSPTSVVSDASSQSSPISSVILVSSASSLGPGSALFSSITPSVSSTVSSLSSTSTPPSLTTGPNGPVTITETSSSTAPPSTGTSESKGKSFLQNKPLAGFVFGLAGLAVFIIAVIAVSAYMRRRNRKRLLADASDFSFDPKDIGDGTSDEKHSRSGLVGHHNSGHGHDGYAPDHGATGGFTGAAIGSVFGPRSSPHPPMPAQIPQDYTGNDGTYFVQYQNLNNVPVGYNPTPNPYDMYGSRNGGGYSNGQSQYDPYNTYNTYGSSGDYPPMTESGRPVPRQLQPGLHPAQGPTFASHLSASPPPLNRSPPIPLTTSPPPASLQPSSSNERDLPRLPSPGVLPDTFGRRDSVDDDAYGGAFLGPDSPPSGPRTLQVANV